MKHAKHLIVKAIIKEFTSRGLDKKYSNEIKEWKKYQKEKKFAKKLDKQIRDEIKLFEEEIKGWEPKELEEIVWDISD